MIDASLSQLMTFYDIIIGNPITRSASQSPCRMQSQITCVKTVIVWSKQSVTAYPLTLTHQQPWQTISIFTWRERWSAQLNVNDLKVNRLTGTSQQIKVKALFDDASFFTTVFYCLHVCLWSCFNCLCCCLWHVYHSCSFPQHATGCRIHRSILLTFWLALWRNQLSQHIK